MTTSQCPHEAAGWLGRLPWVAILLLLPLLVGKANAEELPDRFVVRAGPSYLVDSNMEFSVRAGQLIGTIVNFERDLDGEDTDFRARVGGYFRFNDHHRVDFGWSKIKRDGSSLISDEIRFGGVVFRIEVGVLADLDSEFTKVAYTWSFYHVDKVELGLSVGANVVDYDFSLRNNRGTIAETSSVSEPVPVFGFRMDYSINPRWKVLFSYETFYLELNDDLRGSLDDAQVSIEYRPFRNFSVGLSANRLAVDLSADDDDGRVSVDDLLRGVGVYVGFHF